MKHFPVIGKYYGDAAAKYDEKHTSHEDFHMDQFILRGFLSSYVDPGSKVLDVACGTDRLSVIVSELGGIYHGIDVSSDMVAIAKEKQPDADIQVADARAIPHKDGKFDIVTGVKFLKWIPDDETLKAILEEIARVLKPGGFVFLHQKIATLQAQPYSLKVAVAHLVLRRHKKKKVKSGDDETIRTRAIEEDTFLTLCTQAGLEFRSVSLVKGVRSVLSRKHIDGFYLLEKI